MAPLDTLSLPGETPAGENLELHADFGALERAAKGKPEVQYGNTVEPAAPPDWKEAAALAESLMDRTRDLRVMVHLAIARLNLTGIPAFAGTLTVIRQMLETLWGPVHPQLDPDDDLDPMQRANILLQLQGPQVLRPLRDLPLAATRTERVSWRDIAVFTGAQEQEPGREKLTEAKIRGVFSETDPARLQALQDGVELALKEAAAIPAAFDREAGTGTGPDLKDLVKLLKEIQRDVRRFQPAPGDAAAGADELAAGDGAAPVQHAASQTRGFASLQSLTELTKREDALHALDLAAGYFRAYEPSSPLPLLIERAKRLAGMDFMDILRDLAPDGVTQAQVIAGPVAE